MTGFEWYGKVMCGVRTGIDGHVDGSVMLISASWTCRCGSDWEALGGPEFGSRDLTNPLSNC